MKERLKGSAIFQIASLTAPTLRAKHISCYFKVCLVFYISIFKISAFTNFMQRRHYKDQRETFRSKKNEKFRTGIAASIHFSRKTVKTTTKKFSAGECIVSRTYSYSFVISREPKPNFVVVFYQWTDMTWYTSFAEGNR